MRALALVSCVSSLTLACGAGSVETPALEPAEPAAGAAEHGSCDRAGKDRDALLPWEVQLLSITTLTDEDALGNVRLHFVPPRNQQEAGGAVEFYVVKEALRNGRIVTVLTDIWFPNPIDTRYMHGVTSLVHEGAHVHQYLRAGKERFFQRYTAETVANLGTWEDSLPERRASLAEHAAEDFLAERPDLVAAIRECRDISAELRYGKPDLQAAFLQALEDRAVTGHYGPEVSAAPRVLAID